MKKNRYEMPRMEVVKMQTRRLLVDSDNLRSLPKTESESDDDGISDLEDLL